MRAISCLIHNLRHNSVNLWYFKKCNCHNLGWHTLDMFYFANVYMTERDVYAYGSMCYLYPCSTELFDSSFTRRKQSLLILVTHGRRSCHSQMNLMCVCWLSGQCLTCLAWSDEVKTSDEGTNTPVPQSFLLIVHSSEARFISSGHPWKTIVSQSDESDLCLSTIRSVSDVLGMIWWGENVPRRN